MSCEPTSISVRVEDGPASRIIGSVDVLSRRRAGYLSRAVGQAVWRHHGHRFLWLRELDGDLHRQGKLLLP